VPTEKQVQNAGEVFERYYAEYIDEAGKIIYEDALNEYDPSSDPTYKWDELLRQGADTMAERYTRMTKRCLRALMHSDNAGIADQIGDPDNAPTTYPENVCRQAYWAVFYDLLQSAEAEGDRPEDDDELEEARAELPSARQSEKSRDRVRWMQSL